ncbi:hypothetical protein GGI25_000446 [Coemansia spiralis]|uniref:Uncharacterized protein n=2 Tax=Coemansia TaxID=4863 RepID=A0A9W8GCM9_9FUNG|nr:hypothetical protein EDC05_000273 [Coemansia umbellata]KAJ2624154.1 hypothetical protein GGI26_001729 [Coemansia sp. RSA 1358]KAJ2680810.1 hypothetical protein GGI25_000446 [Coemansia spiralis]
MESLKQRCFHHKNAKQQQQKASAQSQNCPQDPSKGHGIIYTKASDFVLPSEVDKQEISRPVAARKMGSVDVTASDWVVSSGAPSNKELHSLKKHSKQTARALGVSPKRFIEDAQNNVS